jgi:4'-phosphopantetheinyl transferase
LEYVCHNLRYKKIAERFFSPLEFASLCALPADTQRKAFFNYWTHKEALVKATGKGLTRLDEFEILPDEGNFMLSSLKGEEQAACDWTLRQLDPAPDYVAALAVKKLDWQLSYWQKQAD